MSDRKPYIVQPGHSVRAGGQSHRDGATVHLTDADGERLTAQGRVAQAAKGAQGDPLAELLKGKVGEVVERLTALSDDDLVKVAELEAAHSARAGVLKAVEAVQAARAAEAAKGAQGDGAGDQGGPQE